MGKDIGTSGDAREAPTGASSGGRRGGAATPLPFRVSVGRMREKEGEVDGLWLDLGLSLFSFVLGHPFLLCVLGLDKLINVLGH